MDLYAYSIKDKLENIAKANNIEVSRLRGYRLMVLENPEDIETIKKDALQNNGYNRIERLLEIEFYNNKPIFLSLWDDRVEDKKSYYLDRVITYNKKNGRPYTSYIRGIRWDRIHGKFRKLCKFTIKQAVKEYMTQFIMFNKYAGREDVLYIHSRIGKEYLNYKNEPWYLDGCLDSFDSTYCDIYAKINPKTYDLKEIKELLDNDNGRDKEENRII